MWMMLLGRAPSRARRGAGRGARSPSACWLIVLLLAAPISLAAQTIDETFLATLGELRDASFLDKEPLVERLSQSGHPAARSVLTALLEDRLYFRSSDQRVLIVKSTDDS